MFPWQHSISSKRSKSHLVSFSPPWNTEWGDNSFLFSFPQEGAGWIRMREKGLRDPGVKVLLCATDISRFCLARGLTRTSMPPAQSQWAWVWRQPRRLGLPHLPLKCHLLCGTKSPPSSHLVALKPNVTSSGKFSWQPFPADWVRGSGYELHSLWEHFCNGM